MSAPDPARKRRRERPVENQLGGTAAIIWGGRVCPRPRNDPWHHGDVRHAQTQNAVDAKLWVDNRELVRAAFAGTNCVTKTRRSESGKFSDFFRTRPEP
jgi:hypothetical protein